MVQQCMPASAALEVCSHTQPDVPHAAVGRHASCPASAIAGTGAAPQHQHRILPAATAMAPTSATRTAPASGCAGPEAL